VQLLPLPEEARDSGMCDVNYNLYKEFSGVPFVYVSPRRLERHVYVVCKFVGNGVTVAEEGVFYLRRK
jgi:hypothetical protein